MVHQESEKIREPKNHPNPMKLKIIDAFRFFMESFNFESARSKNLRDSISSWWAVSRIA